ncbi:WD40 repeat-like protein, partial [Trichodelitschia bisporula]
MAKRKRDAAEPTDKAPAGKARKVVEASPSSQSTFLQIVTGSYERALHGIIATIPNSLLDPSAKALSVPADDAPQDTAPQDTAPQDPASAITFADSFLFNAHTSSIRCLALSPPPPPTDPTQKVILATGATDERINLYHLSALAPPLPKPGKPLLPTLAASAVSQNPRNRELGALLHHSRAVTALFFPSRAKLLSAAEDNTIAVSRTRDWTVLSTIKAPIPKPVGRPSGDTAAPGEVPAGVNDFAVHPSLKVMVSVGKGERCMRLWNLVTGRKAGVLSFDRAMLAQVGEGRYGTGEGRKIRWDDEGAKFVVAFERGACVYDVDCKPHAIIHPNPQTKLHQIQFLNNGLPHTLAASTEDGRILFYDINETTAPVDSTPPPAQSENVKSKAKPDIPPCRLVAILGGTDAGTSGRIKDFVFLSLPGGERCLVVTGSSDGAVRVWLLAIADVKGEIGGGGPVQVGRLLGTYETGRRITCLTGFVLLGREEGGAVEE